MTTLQRQVAAARRRMVLGRFVRALPWSAAVAFLAAAAVIVAGKYQPAWPAWSTVLGAATGLTLVGAAGFALATRPGPLAAAVELDRRCGLQERVSSALAIQEAADCDDPQRAAMAEAVRIDAEQAVGKFDPRRTFPLPWPKREAWPVVPAAIAVGAALWFTPQITTMPAGDAVEAATTALVQEQAKQLAEKLEERRKEAEQLKLAEAQRLLDKLRDDARQLQSADQVDRKEALLKLSDMAQELAERRKDVAAAQQLQKELSRLKPKQKGPADQFAEAMNKGDFRSAAEELQKLRKELEAKQTDPEKKKQLADQLQQLQKQLEEMADARQKMQEELQQKAQDAASTSSQGEKSAEQKQGGGDRNQAGGADGDQGQGEQAELAEQLSQLAAENGRLDALKHAFEQAAEGMRRPGERQAGQSLDALQQQLESLSQMAGENDLLQRGLDDLAQCKSGMCRGGQPGDGLQGQGESNHGQGQGQQGLAGRGDGNSDASGQRRGQNQGQAGGLLPGRGIGPGLSKDGVSTDGGGGFESRVRGQVGPGQMRAVGPADGPNAKGKVLDEIRKQADAVATGGDTQKLENQPLDRSRREQKRQYFDALRQP